MKTMTAKRLAMLSMASVLLMAVYAIPTGFVAAAARSNNDDNDDEKREFSRLFGNNHDDDDKSKNPKKDPRGDAKDPDGNTIPNLDIRNYGFDNKDAFIEVYGTAGATLPAHHMDAIAYVLNIVTRSGEAQIWAVDSHEAQHGGSTDPSTMWHAHRVHLTDDPDTPEVDSSCLNEVEHVTHAMMDDHKAIFENMKAKGVGAINAKKITSAATVLLEVQVDDPDAPLPPDVHCVAKVAWVYDTADLTERKHKD